MQTLTNQKSRTVSSWLLTGLNLYERMWINQKRSHFWAPCCNQDCFKCHFKCKYGIHSIGFFLALNWPPGMSVYIFIRVINQIKQFLLEIAPFLSRDRGLLIIKPSMLNNFFPVISPMSILLVTAITFGVSGFNWNSNTCQVVQSPVSRLTEHSTHEANP